ncbi:hypothetical protein EJ05DRAFT_541838 [Pseudovirgaria hyperparasitica]|uniref:Uncharacterized protein n=1 Tax=Pseudovirgaria hyperparasitica TaxID=470096 RepID=A0A6A6VVM3_9PEZI|nr:uncharacterized protein EJ05DRAFT_541838 [Pseudovirgaria hyperparasitica]KAF2753291.1 hypothetical protein EJ05DRAFT_541838 [Pseudovirgaria hyperparasitica]
MYAVLKTAGVDAADGLCSPAEMVNFYDSCWNASKSISKDVNFPFAPDNSRDLVVGIQNVVMDSLQKTSVHLVKRAFGLLYDDTLHKPLQDINANVKFTLGVSLVRWPAVDIILSYSAFNLIATPPYRSLDNNTMYSPLRHTQDSGPYAQGRMFLQEAYVIVDFKRYNFSVCQHDWELGVQPHIVTINPPLRNENLCSANSTTATGSRLLLGWRKRVFMQKFIAEATALAGKGSPPNRAPIAEMPNWRVTKSSRKPNYLARVQRQTPASPVDTEGLKNQIYEMVGSTQERNEADGRQSTEKQAVVHRERMCDGSDQMNPNTPLTPAFQDRHLFG